MSSKALYLLSFLNKPAGLVGLKDILLKSKKLFQFSINLFHIHQFELAEMSEDYLPIECSNFIQFYYRITFKTIDFGFSDFNVRTC